ncbi:MAG: LarC family nickel insertion protein [Coriobacteriales bacterium]|nr:LarC family nickel insertion protein [Coriobacteriales bacterium]
MKLLHLDLSTGASGDKLVGALLDLCLQRGLLDAEAFTERFRAALPTARIKIEGRKQGSLKAWHIDVAEDDPPHRRLADLKTLFEQVPGVSTPALEAALASLKLIAQAESEVHELPLEEVHFHEVGAADSVVDMLGFWLLWDELGKPRISFTPLACGHGTISCAHGVLPVPAPATAKLLCGLPTTPGAFACELTTPTGAALIRQAGQMFGAGTSGSAQTSTIAPTIRLEAIGYGVGSRDLGETPNIVQAMYGEALSDQTVLLECNLDHISPEQIGNAVSQLSADRRSFDVWQEVVFMKKQRLAIKLCLLCDKMDATALSAAIMRLTTSLGVRACPVKRTVAAREGTEEVTALGTVRFKRSALGPEFRRPEADDVARVMKEKNLSWEEAVARLLADA